MDSMKKLAEAMEELPDGSTLDLQPDRLWRVHLLEQLDKAGCGVLRSIDSAREALEETLSSFKTLDDETKKATDDLDDLLEHLAGRIQRLRYVTGFDRREQKSKLHILEHLPPFQKILDDAVPSLKDRSKLLPNIATVISELNQWRWEVQTLWIPPRTPNQNVHLPEVSEPLQPPKSWTPAKVSPDASPLEKSAASSLREIASIHIVDAFASWLAELDANKEDLFKTIGVVQDVYLLREQIAPRRESAVISIAPTSGDASTSWIRVARSSSDHSEETIMFANSKDAAFGPADVEVEAIISDLATETEGKGSGPTQIITLPELASYLRIIASACPPYPHSVYSHRWFARHVVMALRRARHGPGHIPDDPLADLYMKNPDDDERGVWNDAQSLICLSEVFNANFRHEYALELAERGLALIESTPNPRASEYRRKPFASALRVKYEALAGLDRAEEALKVIRSACDVLASGHRLGPYADGRQADTLDSLASTLSVLDEIEEAIKVEGEAVEKARELLKLDHGDHAPRLASLLINQADLFVEDELLDDALTAAKESLSIYQDLYKHEPDIYRKDLTVASGTLASILFRTDQASEAIKMGQYSLKLCEQLFDLQPDIYRDDLAERHYQQALYSAEADDFEAACEHGLKAVEHRQWLYEHQPSIHRFGLAQFLTNYSGDLMSEGSLTEAIDAGREALRLFRELNEESPQGYEQDLRMSLENLSTYLEQVGEKEEALKLRKEAETIEIDGFSDDTVDDGWEDESEDEHDHDHGHSHHHHHH